MFPISPQGGCCSFVPCHWGWAAPHPLARPPATAASNSPNLTGLPRTRMEGKDILTRASSFVDAAETTMMRGKESGGSPLSRRSITSAPDIPPGRPRSTISTS